MRTKNEIDHVRNERNVLAMADNPFVVKMYYSFQSKVPRFFDQSKSIQFNNPVDVRKICIWLWNI